MTADSDFSVRPVQPPEIARLNAIRDKNQQGRKDQQDQREKKRKKQSAELRQTISEAQREADNNQPPSDGDEPAGQIDLKV